MIIHKKRTSASTVCGQFMESEQSKKDFPFHRYLSVLNTLMNNEKYDMLKSRKDFVSPKKLQGSKYKARTSTK
jgi:hypothetical protein